ncbi:hypothetical protein EDB89DRAFT_2073183 [Lactarius sanguifluus]|nr:hypothetical protein EDB89DRAFT_2073183 [Lactarius sanguifluus]
MLPMGIFLEKLTQTSALRLYRLPPDSQLLRRLGPAWYAGQGDLPLVVTSPAASDGPRVDLTAVAPWEVPNWAGQLSYMGTGSPHTRKDWTRDLIRHAEGLSIGISFVHGCVSAAGRDDERTVGAAAATFSVAGQALTGLDWTLGTEALQFDAEVFGIAKTVEALAMYYTEEVAPPDAYYIFSSSSSALQAARNPRNRSAQKHALMFHQSLTTLSLRHANVRFYLVWTPVDENLEGQQVARHRAVEACKRDPPQGLDRVQSAAFQKDRARRRAFQQWNDKWLGDTLIPEFNRRVLGEAAVSHHHHYLITAPPAHDKHHPLWTAATDMEHDANGKKTKTLKFTRRTTSTALQVATDHAFTGTYARRFRPSYPPESTSCPCGEATGTRSVEHILLHCPRFVQPCISYAILSTAWNPVHPLLQYSRFGLCTTGHPCGPSSVTSPSRVSPRLAYRLGATFS